VTGAPTETRSVVVEREMPFPAEKIWRALTQPHLIAEWLMKGDFRLEVGHRFDFRPEWGSIDCEVLEVEPQRTLAYSWAARGLESVVTWTLTPTAAGTLLRMEQSGFQRDHKQALGGALAGWTRFLASLEQVVSRID